jgi:hypothetical protein
MVDVFLRVNIVTGRRFIPMGTEVDDVLVPESARRFQCSETEAAELREMCMHAQQRAGEEKVSDATTKVLPGDSI